MKKLTLFFLALLACGLAFQACDNTKTYAEMLEEEKDAIKAFIRDSSITVISQTEFYRNDSTTDVLKNEYVQLASGVYMQIVDKGSENPADTVKPNDQILVRFMEYSLIDKAVTLSNLSYAEVVDEFNYRVTSSSIAGQFTQGFMLYYGTSVPAGWLVPLAYVRDGAHVKLIVPSKMGHNSAMQQVYPYYYDIRKYQIYR
ncbi:DUF4827 domain-containing protein [Bacteroides stercorirosoris]|uniref:DUF4827 domain-containing protein n=1 Tax=Bacteroides stercorirosoris TaxID=871324 RepID=UPI0035213DCB